MIIPTYIINLKSCPDRKAYMEKELAPFSFLEQHFIEGVDGRIMTCAEQEKVFDQNKAYKRYGRILGCGEVGCTLSHLSCCRNIVESGAAFGLIVEDDLVFRIPDRAEAVFGALINAISIPEPAIMLLNGDYWFYGKQSLCEGFDKVVVYDAVCAGAYLINAPAAQVMINSGKSHIADDWLFIKKQGIRLSAVYPHIADQNRLDFQTTIANVNTGRMYRLNIPIKRRLQSYFESTVKYVLKHTDHFESKQFVW